MKKRPYLFIVIGVLFFIIPPTIYLCFLIPQLSERYNALMSSAGILAAGGMYGSEKIPENFKFSGLFKLSSKSFTILTVIVIVEEFIIKLVGLAAVIIIGYIIYRICMEGYKNAREQINNSKLATEIARNINKNTK